MLYDAKKLDMEVFIILENDNVKLAQYTLDNCCNLVYDYKKTVVAPESVNKEAFTGRGFKTIYGGKFYCDMIDISMKNCVSEWAFLLKAGTKIQNRIDEKNSRYISRYNDVIFPVVNRVYNFSTLPLNGLLLNKAFYNEVGEFGDYESQEITKLIWADKAMQFGAKFKAIVGVRQ